MKATLVDRAEDRATVRLTPCWLARLFGARETVCELTRRCESGKVSAQWCAMGTGRTLREIDHGWLIHDALDFAPVGAPPLAIARRP